MKRLFVVFICIALLICMASVSYASIDFRDSFFNEMPYLINRDGGNTLFGVLNTGNLTEEQINFIEGFSLGMNGDQSSMDNFLVLIRLNSIGESNPFIYFIRSSSSLSISYNDSTKQLIINSSGASNSFRYMSFRHYLVNSNYVPSPLYNMTSPLNFGVNLNTGSIPVDSTWDSCVLWKSGNVNFSFDYSLIECFHNGSIGFIDNSGLFDFDSDPDPDPSSSEPPSSSSDPGGSSSGPGGSSSGPGGSSSGPGGSSNPGGSNGDGEFLPGTPQALIDFCNFYIDVIITILPVGIFIFAIYTGLSLLPKILRIFIK